MVRGGLEKGYLVGWNENQSFPIRWQTVLLASPTRKHSTTSCARDCKLRWRQSHGMGVLHLVEPCSVSLNRWNYKKRRLFIYFTVKYNALSLPLTFLVCWLFSMKLFCSHSKPLCRYFFRCSLIYRFNKVIVFGAHKTCTALR